MPSESGIIISGEALAVNFREVCMGNIAPKILYRSSHPIKKNDQENIISRLAAKAEIAAVINLCDTDSGIAGKASCSDWYSERLKNDQVIALGMDFDITGAAFRQKLKTGLQFILRTEGPWLIHCYAGVDRTGFVCMILESFMGAPLDNVISDYLKSFYSVYDSSIFEEADRENSIIAMKFLSIMSDSEEVNAQNLQTISEKYLRSRIGISAGEIELLRNKLAGIGRNSLTK